MDYEFSSMCLEASSKLQQIESAYPDTYALGCNALTVIMAGYCDGRMGEAHTAIASLIDTLNTVLFVENAPVSEEN